MNVKIISIIVLVLVLSIGVSSATWCDTDFAKRVNISVNNTAGSALTYYQVYVNLTANPINETSMRVYNTTDCTLRPHWCENETGGNCYGVWINYSAVAASVWTNDTAIYYDNAAASSVSNISTTFVFGDDFNRANSDTVGNGWVEVGAWSILNNTLKSSSQDSSYSVHNITFSESYIVSVWKKRTEAARDTQFEVFGDVADRRCAFNFYGAAIKYLDNVNWQSTGKTFSVGVWYNPVITFHPGTGKTDYELATLSWSLATVTPFAGTRTNEILFGQGSTGGGSGEAFYDDVTVRKYATNEPTTETGTEEAQPGMVIISNEQPTSPISTHPQAANFVINATISEATNNSWEINRTGSYEHLEWDNSTTAPAYTFSPQTEGEGTYKVKLTAYNTTVPTDNACTTWDVTVSNMTISSPSPGSTDTKYVSNRTVTYSATTSRTANCSWKYQNGTLIEWDNSTTSPATDVWINNSDVTAFNISLTVYDVEYPTDYNSTTWNNSITDDVFDYTNYTWERWDVYNNEMLLGCGGSITFGDADNDGSDEMVLVESPVYLTGIKDIIFYDMDGTSKTYTDITSHTDTYIEASVHDVDQDGTNELFVMYSDPALARADVFRFNATHLNGSNTDKVIMTSGSNNPKTFSWINISDQEHFYTVGCGKGETVDIFLNLTTLSTNEIDDYSHSGEDNIAWDIDGDGDLELLVIEGYSANSAVVWLYELNYDTGAYTTKTMLFNNDLKSETHYTANLMVGDVDNDGIDNLIIFWTPTASPDTRISEIEAYEFDGISVFGEGNYSEGFAIDSCDAWDCGCTAGHGKYFVDDVDGDGLNEFVAGTYSYMGNNPIDNTLLVYDITAGGASITRRSIATFSQSYMGGAANFIHVLTPGFYDGDCYVVLGSDNTTAAYRSELFKMAVKEEPTPTLHINNAINLKEDWGRDFNSNFSANVTIANASSVWMNFTNSEFTNTSLGWLNLTLNEWVNESHNVNPIVNVSVTVFLNGSGATNDSDSFYYEITKRTNTATMDSSATQNADTSETFYVNGTCNEEYSETFYGAADLLEDGSIVATDSSVTDYVNFSHSENVAGQYNYTIRFYNLTHYDNVTTPTYSNVTVYGVPVITLLEQTPTTIYMNTTGTLTFKYGIQHSSVGLNNSTLAFRLGIYDSIVDTWNWSYFAPTNDMAAEVSTYSQILRQRYRNRTDGSRLNWESNTNITEGNIWKWTGLDNTSSYVTITPINSTYTNVTVERPCYSFISAASRYLDMINMLKTTKVQSPIHTGRSLMLRMWDPEIIQGADNNFVMNMYFDTEISSPPPNWDVEIWACNQTWDNTTDWKNNDNCTYLTAANPTTWMDHIFTTANVSYARVVSVNATTLGFNPDYSNYIIFESRTPAAKPYYLNITNAATITNRSFAQTETLWEKTNGVWNAVAYTPSAMFLTKREGRMLYNDLWFADNNANEANSTLKQNIIGGSIYSPTTPALDHFFFDGANDYEMNGTYNGTFDVNVAPGTDPDGGTTTHNLTLHYGNHTFVATINNTFTDGDVVGNFVNVSFDSSSYYSAIDNYTLKCVATDDESDTSTTWLGVNFTLTALVGEYEPPNPTNLQNVTGNFWINHTWSAGAPGNVSDSFNVSVFPGWYNTTLTTYYNDSGLLPHDWNNVTVWAFNSSGNGSLSAGNVSDDVQIPNNPITLTVTQAYNKLETQTVFISDTLSSDVDSDTPTYSCNRTDLFADFSTTTGYGNWTTGTTAAGTYHVNVGVSDGWDSTDNKTLTITIVDATPGAPSALANTTGNFWVNHTWSAGANTDSFNVSVFPGWYNTTLTTYYNDSGLLPHDWNNVSVHGFNATSGELSSSVSQNTQIPNNLPVLSGLPDNTTTEDINQTDIFDLDDYFSDVDSDTPTYLVESNNQSAYVSVTINASNNVSYTLASGWNGTASVVINATDGWGGEDSDTFLIIVNAAAGPSDYIPDNPTTLANATGNYWVNYTWNVGSGGNVTDSYNVSWNLTWYNTTTNTFMKKEVGASNWANITVYAYNNSGNGSLSAGSISDNVQAPAFVPSDYVPPNPTTLANTTGNYYVNYTWVVGVSGNITDSYNVSWNLTWYNTTLTTYMQKEVGASNWANITVYAYNSSGNGTLSSGGVSDETQAPAFVPGDYIPATPTTLANTTGNYYVNFTWSSGGGANVTDSYNISWNLSWYNNTLTTYMQKEVGASNWGNISVYAYNSSGGGSLSSGYITDNVQAPAYVPGDYIPPTPITLANTTGNYYVNFTWSSGGGANITDSYNVSWNTTWYNTTLTTYMQKEVGASNWGNITVYAYNTSGSGSLSANYITDNVQAPAYVPNDYIPSNPTTLQNTTGNYYVNYTWIAGGGVNITDSYNVSWNLTWYNNTLTTYMQKEVGAEGWANITVYAYNSSGSGSLSTGYLSDETQAPAAAPIDYQPATPTTLANTTGNGWVHYTWSSGGGANITDSYNVSWNLTWYNTTLVAYMNDTVGAFGWANISVWAYNSTNNGSLSAGNIVDNTQAAGGTFTTSMTTTVYNLITYYGSSTSTAEQFGSNIGGVDYVAMYNGSFYSHTMGFVANNFTIYHGISYYVYLNATGSSTYQRNNISDTPYNTQLYNRWNTIGWTNATDTNAEGIASSIGSACKYTSSLNADGITYTTHTVGFASNNHDVTKGKGYWVWVNTNTNWGRNS